MVLDDERGHGIEAYSIALDGITDSAHMLDWIFQLRMKAWVTNDIIGDLISAFQDIFRRKARSADLARTRNLMLGSTLKGSCRVAHEIRFTRTVPTAPPTGSVLNLLGHSPPTGSALNPCSSWWRPRQGRPPVDHEGISQSFGSSKSPGASGYMGAMEFNCLWNAL